MYGLSMTPPVILAHLQTEAPTRIYHYTSAEALIGVALNKELWCTESRFLNDSSEIVHFAELVRNTINMRIDEEAHRKGVQYFMWAIMEEINFSRPYLYIASFTEQPNSLSQWRAYCPQSGGYAIGVPTSQVRSVSSYNTNFYKCIYEPHIKLSIADEIVDALIASFIEQFPNEINRDDEFPHDGGTHHLCRQAQVADIYRIASLVKHESFKEEEEWRIVITNGTSGKSFRGGSKGVVPYCKLPFLKEVTAELKNNVNEAITITVGPSLDLENRKQAAMLLLQNSNLNIYNVDSQLIMSDMPYKTW
jgi:hypothetical protein